MRDSLLAVALIYPRSSVLCYYSLLATRYSLLATRYSLLAPHLLRHLNDAAQLRPLLVLGQQIALLGRGKAALAGDAELLERGVFRRLLDAALELVLAFELAALGGDDAEHDELALGQHAQRLEAAGARI